jgi:hypothetical protein
MMRLRLNDNASCISELVRGRRTARGSRSWGAYGGGGGGESFLRVHWVAVPKALRARRVNRRRRRRWDGAEHAAHPGAVLRRRAGPDVSAAQARGHGAVPRQAAAGAGGAGQRVLPPTVNPACHRQSIFGPSLLTRPLGSCMAAALGTSFPPPAPPPLTHLGDRGWLSGRAGSHLSSRQEPKMRWVET